MLQRCNWITRKFWSYFTSFKIFKTELNLVQFWGQNKLFIDFGCTSGSFYMIVQKALRVWFLIQDILLSVRNVNELICLQIWCKIWVMMMQDKGHKIWVMMMQDMGDDDARWRHMMQDKGRLPYIFQWSGLQASRHIQSKAPGPIHNLWIDMK